MALNRFSRNELLLGSAGQQALSQASVAVIGLGGVGSYAAEALCRAGVGHLTIVDFDDICLTNVNRQLHALDGTVGLPKVNVMAQRLSLINPDAEVMPLKDFYSEENSNYLFSRKFDYVVDAIDHFTSKVHLILACLNHGIPVVSSMGAANKLDPGRIKVADISGTHTCRMARSLRKLLKKEGVSNGFKVVFSTEEFRPLEGQNSGCKEDCICPNRGSQQFYCEHRRVILGSISYIPGIFGLTMAGVVINDLLASNQND
ncbi:tRNA threonylcarbamoyladenosine dehydratase [Geobacter sp. OR-1]|uniref:tRNA threonylcarbamoyladenosine dehydratase n=1 Tax=Geobacter sp. OR-1 TaxID=1266765 RepID=UPI0005444762|nr:tRNA threonylcarbamoyladenosine dehydratase [Geobacter sp. OR-1]GAM09262.1 tRNA threonylcarbamoyladenosine dehydratase [Geobacter sp. OR-1]